MINALVQKFDKFNDLYDGHGSDDDDDDDNYEDEYEDDYDDDYDDDDDDHSSHELNLLWTCSM